MPKRHISPYIDQIQAELINQTGNTVVCSGIHELFNFTFDKEELPEQ
jgi:hypothetical protein